MNETSRSIDVKCIRCTDYKWMPTNAAVILCLKRMYCMPLFGVCGWVCVHLQGHLQLHQRSGGPLPALMTVVKMPVLVSIRRSCWPSLAISSLSRCLSCTIFNPSSWFDINCRSKLPAQRRIWKEKEETENVAAAFICGLN